MPASTSSKRPCAAETRGSKRPWPDSRPEQRALLGHAGRDHAGGGRPVSAMFRSFSVFNYRVWFIGALVSNIGAWMQNTAMSWVVLTELTDNDPGSHGHHDGPAVRPAAPPRPRDGLGRRPVRPASAAWSSPRRLLLLLGLAIGILLLTGSHDAAASCTGSRWRSASSPPSTTRSGRPSCPTSWRARTPRTRSRSTPRPSTAPA